MMTAIGFVMLGIGGGIAAVHLWRWNRDRQWRRRHENWHRPT